MRSEIIVGLLAVCGAWGCGGDDESTFTPPSAVITPTGTLTGVPGVITSRQNPSTSSGLPPGTDLFQGVPGTATTSGGSPALVNSTGGVVGQTTPGFTGADSNPFVTGVGTADPFVTGVGSTPFITGAGPASSVGGVGTFSAQDTVADAAPGDDDVASGGAGGAAPLTPVVGLGGAGGAEDSTNAGGQGGAGHDCPDP